MNYKKKYEKKKADILKLFALNVENSDELKDEGFVLRSFNFGNGRNEDDFIEFVFDKNINLSITIHLWINFWINYEYNDDFIVTYYFRKITPNSPENSFFEDSLNFKNLKGCTLNEKIENLFKEIKKTYFFNIKM